MRKWEYKSIEKGLGEYGLNDLGKEGWELVSHSWVMAVSTGYVDNSLISNQEYIFKRELFHNGKSY